MISRATISRIAEFGQAHADNRGTPSCIDRRPGHEVAFAELVERRVTGAAALMAQARRYYLAHAGTLGHEPVAWEELSVLTIRAWVAVAREAQAVHAPASWDPMRDPWP